MESPDARRRKDAVNEYAEAERCLALEFQALFAKRSAGMRAWEYFKERVPYITSPGQYKDLAQKLLGDLDQFLALTRSTQMHHSQAREKQRKCHA
jgi:hypothetical protein